jgi:glycosyltransferase involved in cell wall biosynthesis
MLLENNPYPHDTRVRNEAESLTAAGYFVTVVAPREGPQARTETVNGVDVQRYRTLWAGAHPASYAAEYAVAHAQLLTRALRALADGANILHFHGPPDTLFLAGVVARLFGRQVIFDLHDSGPELFQAKFGHSPLTLALLRAAQRAAIRCASQVIVTNQSQLEMVRSRGSIPGARISMVRNGPRKAEFHTATPGRGGELRDMRLVYVGALDMQDGVLELPNLLLAPALARATLTVVGDGPARREIETRCVQHGLQGRTTFTGHVPHAEIPRLIAAADIGVDPAPGTELNHGSTMIKVLEYMAAGRPLVAYDLRETRRSAGQAALYAPCGDPAAFAALVAELARDGGRRARMEAGALQRVRGLTWERSSQVLRDAYEKLGLE